MLGSTFLEHCKNLGIEPHDFDSPILRGTCIQCGLTAGQHSATDVVQSVVERSPAVMEAVQMAPRPEASTTKAEPLFKVVTACDGREFMSSSWSSLEQAQETFNVVKSATSLQVHVLMQLGGVEVDIISIARKFLECGSSDISR